MAREQITGAEKAAILSQFPTQVAAFRKQVAATRRRNRPKQKSGLRQAPKPTSRLTATQRAESQARQAETDKAVAASERQRVADSEAQNLQRISQGRESIDVRPARTQAMIQGILPGPEFTRIHGIPEAAEPRLFEQNFTGPLPGQEDRPFRLPPFASARPVAGVPGTTEDITGEEKATILAQAGIRPAPPGTPPVEVKKAQARVQIPGQEPPISQMIATSQPQIRPEQKIRTIDSGAGTPGGVTTTGSRPLPWRNV